MGTCVVKLWEDGYVSGLGTVITAIITPFHSDGRVDEETFVSLLKHLGANGSDGFVIAGSTGEGSTLDDDEHLALVKLALDERPDGTTVIANAGSNDTRHSLHLTERCTELGVDGTLNAVGYYNRPNRAGIKAHYELVARATDKPVVLYNIPSRTTIDMDNDLLAELAQLPNVDYVKQANSDNLALIDGLGIYAGNDEDYARTLDLGGLGTISVASHIAGSEMAALAAMPADDRQVANQKLAPLYAAMGVTVNPIPVKAALQMIGLIPDDMLRLPLVPCDEQQRDAVRDALQTTGFLAN